MAGLLRKLFFTTLLTSTALFQGWPLLVAKTCEMPAPQIMNQIGDCCCCDNPPNSSVSFSACTPGKRLIGFLSTDPSLLPTQEKIKKGDGISPVVVTIPSTELQLSINNLSLLSDFYREKTPFLHTLTPPIFLIDRVFRI